MAVSSSSASPATILDWSTDGSSLTTPPHTQVHRPTPSLFPAQQHPTLALTALHTAARRNHDCTVADSSRLRCQSRSVLDKELVLRQCIQD